MSVKVEYKDCLKFYIVTLESNASKLAKYINVDSSLVNKWLKGTRLPSSKSNYNKEIAIYLSNQIKTTFQLKEIREFHVGLDPSIIKIDDITVQILYVLTESRGFSNIKKKDALLEMENDEILTNTQSLSKSDLVINGVFSIGVSAKVILTEASKQKGNGRNIYIILDKFLENLMFFSSEKEIFDVLAILAKNNWKIHIVFERDSNVTVLLRILNIVMPLLRIGNVFTYSLKDECSSRRFDAIIVVQGLGALVGFDVTGLAIQEKAMLFKTEAAVEMLNNQIRHYITSFCESVIRFYQIEKLDNYSKKLIESEYYPGARIIYKYGFSSLLIPEHIYTAMVERYIDDLGKRKAITDFYKVREKAFLDNLAYTDNTHIYSFSFLHEIITSKKLDIYTHIGIERVEVTDEEIISILRNAVELLSKFSHFNIIFQYSSDENYFMLNDYYCSFKQRTYSTFELIDTDSSSIVIRMSMESQNLLNAMEAYYDGIISKNQFGKKTVIQQLLNAIDMIEANNTFL